MIIMPEPPKIGVPFKMTSNEVVSPLNMLYYFSNDSKEWKYDGEVLKKGVTRCFEVVQLDSRGMDVNDVKKALTEKYGKLPLVSDDIKTSPELKIDIFIYYASMN